MSNSAYSRNLIPPSGCQESEKSSGGTTRPVQRDSQAAVVECDALTAVKCRSEAPLSVFSNFNFILLQSKILKPKSLFFRIGCNYCLIIIIKLIK